MTTALFRLTVLIAGFMLTPAMRLSAEDYGALTTSNRIISVDWQKVKGVRPEVFRECVGAGRAFEGLRAEWQKQLKLCQQEIGFKYIRFHGLLCDEMGVYTETKEGQPIYNWQYIDQLYDFLLSIHVRPFVEISFMPSALASGDQTVCWWRGNVTPPKSYDRWDALIKALVQHWTERYGKDEVKKWFFEIWNEPDHPAFLSAPDPQHRLQEYLDLYTHTAKDVKSVNAAYRVGGPAGAGAKWVPYLFAYCGSNDVPVDFISFHSYGLTGGPSGFDQFGNKLCYLGKNFRGLADYVAGKGAAIKAAHPGLPVCITEWSTSYSGHDPVHDSYFSAPYILEQLKHTEQGVDVMSYWAFTDIFEELGPPMTPFQGGFGLLNVQGIKKPAFFAYQFLNRLGATELKNQDPASWVCRDDHGGIQVLLWDLTRPTNGAIANQIYFRKLLPAKSKGTVSVVLANMPAGAYHLGVWEIGDHKNDAYSAYLEMGSPSQLTRAQDHALRAAASGKPEVEREVVIGKDGHFEETLPLCENYVLLLTLTPAREVGRSDNGPTQNEDDGSDHALPMTADHRSVNLLQTRQSHS